MTVAFCSMSPLNINPVPPPLLLYTNNLNLNRINNKRLWNADQTQRREAQPSARKHPRQWRKACLRMRPLRTKL